MPYESDGNLKNSVTSPFFSLKIMQRLGEFITDRYATWQHVVVVKNHFKVQ